MNLNFIKSFFCDKSGKGSSKRIVIYAIVFTFCFSYIKVALSTQTFTDIGIIWATLLAALSGISLFFSKLEKQGEIEK